MLDKRCMTCHDGSNPHLANLDGYDNLKKVTEQDTGTDIFHAGARLAHPPVRNDLHFLHPRPHLQPRLCAAGVVQVLDHVLPFVSVAIDVSSWYLVKVYHPFAWVTMAPAR